MKVYVWNAPDWDTDAFCAIAATEGEARVLALSVLMQKAAGSFSYKEYEPAMRAALEGPPDEVHETPVAVTFFKNG